MGNVVNAFTFVLGCVYKAIECVLEHPAHPGLCTVWIGEYFLATNFKNQPRYSDRNGNIAYLHSIDVELKERIGKQPLPLLIPGNDGSPLYLHVRTDVETKGELLENFWQGTMHQGDTIAHSCPQNGNYEELIALKRDGDSVDIFCRDGMVYRVQRVGREFTKLPLALQDVARLRLELVKNELETIGEDGLLTKDERFKRVGYWLHQLAAIGRVGGRRFPELQEEIFAIFLQYARDGMVSMSVKNHVMEGLAYAPVFLADFLCEIDIAYARKGSGGAFGQLMESAEVINLDEHRPAAGKTRAERERKKAERAAEDRAEREAMKGKSTGKPELRSNPDKLAKLMRKHGQRR